MIFTGRSVDALDEALPAGELQQHHRRDSAVSIAASWFSSLRRPAKRTKRPFHAHKQAKSAWDLSTLNQIAKTASTSDLLCTIAIDGSSLFLLLVTVASIHFASTVLQLGRRLNELGIVANKKRSSSLIHPKRKTRGYRSYFWCILFGALIKLGTIKSCKIYEHGSGHAREAYVIPRSQGRKYEEEERAKLPYSRQRKKQKSNAFTAFFVYVTLVRMCVIPLSTSEEEKSEVSRSCLMGISRGVGGVEIIFGELIVPVREKEDLTRMLRLRTFLYTLYQK